MRLNSKFKFVHYKMIDGVGSYGEHIRRYWVDSTASSFESLIASARYEWVNTSDVLTTSIYIRKATSQSSSVFDVYFRQEFASGLGILAESRFYDTSDNRIYSLSSDYKWTEIILNGSNFNSLSNFDKEGTISHEFGHCMGLAHSTSSYRIMTQLGNGRLVNKPSYADLITINHLYG